MRRVGKEGIEGGDRGGFASCILRFGRRLEKHCGRYREKLGWFSSVGYVGLGRAFESEHGLDIAGRSTFELEGIGVVCMYVDQ